MMQPNIANQSIIAFLMKVKLMVAPQAHVGLAVLVEVRCCKPASTLIVGEEEHAFADVDKHSNVSSAPRETNTLASCSDCIPSNSYLLGLMSHASTLPSRVMPHHAANGLAAEYLAAEEANTRICHLP